MYGSLVYTHGLHSFFLQTIPPGILAREHVLIARAFASAGIKEGLSRSNGKPPDGLTPIPWQAGKVMSKDVTIVCPLAKTYAEAAAR